MGRNTCETNGQSLPRCGLNGFLEFWLEGGGIGQIDEHLRIGWNARNVHGHQVELEHPGEANSESEHEDICLIFAKRFAELDQSFFCKEVVALARIIRPE